MAAACSLGGRGDLLGARLGLADRRLRPQRRRQDLLGALGETAEIGPRASIRRATRAPDAASATARAAASRIAAPSARISVRIAPAWSRTLAGGGLGGLGERPHLVGHHRETAAVLAGPARLQGGVEGEQPGLVGKTRHRPGDVADARRRPVEVVDDADRGVLAAGLGLEARDRLGDLGAGLGEPRLERAGAPARQVGPLPRGTEAPDDRRDGGEGFLRRARRFLGPPAIRSIARLSSSAAAAASVVLAASSSVAAPRRSTAF